LVYFDLFSAIPTRFPTFVSIFASISAIICHRFLCAFSTYSPP